MREGWGEEECKNIPKVKRHCIEEPGHKIRIVTASQAALVTYL